MIEENQNAVSRIQQSSSKTFAFSQAEKQKVPKIFSKSSIFRFASKTQVVLMIVGTIASILMGAVVPIFAFITGDTIDSFQSTSTLRDKAKENLLYYTYLGVGALGVGILMYSAWMIAGERQAYKCRKAYFQALLRQEPGWFDCQQQAKISTTFQLDSNSYQLAVGEKISSLIMILSMFLTGIAVSFYIGWMLTLVCLLYIPILILCWTKSLTFRAEVSKEEDEVYRECASRAQESLTAIKLLKQMNSQQFECSLQNKFLEKLKGVYKSLKSACSYFMTVICFNAFILLGFWYGSECVFDTDKCPQSLSGKSFTPGSIAKIMYSLLIPAISLNQLAPCLQKIAEGRQAAARIFEVIDRVPLIYSKPDALKPPSFGGLIEFKNVTFAYPKQKNLKILENANVVIDCRHSAIIGKSGSGKSTVFQLIMRFYDPDEGAIYLDGTNLRDLDLEWLRSQIGYVTQEPILFATTIKENMLMAKSNATEEEIAEALAKAEALQFVAELNKKLDTYVGNRGNQLSGGQKQRIAIARVLLKKPKFLLLDEATSALDTKNQAEILKTLQKVSEEFMTISITHRSLVLLNCDKVYSFQDRTLSEARHQINSLTTLKSTEEQQIKLQLNDSPIKSLKSNKNDLSPVKEPSIIEKTLQHIQEGQQKLQQAIPRIFTYLKNRKLLLSLGILLAILYAVIFPTIGVLLAKLFVAFLQYPSNQQYYSGQVRIYCYIILAIGLLEGFVVSLDMAIFATLGEKVVRQIRHQAFSKIVRMPIPWFEDERNQPQKIISQLTLASKSIYSFIRVYISHLIMVLVTIIYSLIGSLIFEWRTSLTSFGLIPLIILSQGIQMAFVTSFAETKIKFYGEASSLINESANCSFSRRRYNNSLSEILAAITKKSIFSGLMYGISYLLHYLSVALMFYFSGIFISDYGISPDRSLPAMFLIIFAGLIAGMNTTQIPDLYEIKVSAKNIFKIIDLKDQDENAEESDSKKMKTAIKGDIQFIDVSFKYNNRDFYALEHLSFHVEQGKFIGLIGESGSGKSTVISLLLRFYQPSSGTILIDGIDIKQYDLHHLRSSFGVVSQQPILFNESIEWNIRYNLVDSTQEEIIIAAKEASFDPQDLYPNKLIESAHGLCESRYSIVNTQSAIIHEEFEGFKKNVGPHGSHISGGQKQRLAIARALLRRPSVLLLDEATSALDPENQGIVQHSLQRIMKGKTTISITHRLQTTKRLSKLYLMKRGSISESGSYEELMSPKKLMKDRSSVESFKMI